MILHLEKEALQRLKESEEAYREWLHSKDREVYMGEGLLAQIENNKGEQ